MTSIMTITPNMIQNDNFQADLGKAETIRLTNNGRDGQLQHGLPDWLYEGDGDGRDNKKSQNFL